MTDSRESSNRPDEMEAVKTTIVGGRPPGSGKAVGPIPRGIEVLIKKAAVDAEFRELLLSRRAASADEIGLTLTPAEKMMLDAAPADQLARIIGQTRVDPAIRPVLQGKVSTTMLIALGIGAAATAAAVLLPSLGCQPDRELEPAGNRPDRPMVQPAEVDPPATQPRTITDLDGNTLQLPPGSVGGTLIEDLRPPLTQGIRPDRPDSAP